MTQKALLTVLCNKPITDFHFDKYKDLSFQDTAGADPGGGAPGARPPLPKIGKNMIFHTKYPKNFRASLRSAQCF
jgi:hypothetical protein